MSSSLGVVRVTVVVKEGGSNKRVIASILQNVHGERGEKRLTAVIKAQGWPGYRHSTAPTSNVLGGVPELLLVGKFFVVGQALEIVDVR